MIYIEDKHKCVGCYGCASACPTECIELKADIEGFFYPVVDIDKCVDCGLCERVCPVLHQDEVHEPLLTYAAVNLDEQVRAKSSSGGVFTLLAEKTITNGGVVFGVVFNAKWEVVHTAAHNMNELAPMRGSKYVQSQIGKCYKEAQNYLKEGKDVLFSGTPCQIAGLRRYLQEEYNNLVCVDIICHGVPSPAVFKAYLTEEANSLGVGLNDLQSFSFRDKREGWRKYSLARSYAIKIKGNVLEISKNLKTDLYMKGFLSDIYLRPSCYTCPSKELKSGSDMTIADFWGIDHIMPDLDDDKGTSLVCINSEKGSLLFDSISSEIIYKEVSFSDAIHFNPSFNYSVKKPISRKSFFSLFGTMNVSAIMKRFTKTSFKKHLKQVIAIGLKKLGMINTANKIIICLKTGKY